MVKLIQSDAPQLLIVAAESAPWTDAVTVVASPSPHCGRRLKGEIEILQEVAWCATRSRRLIERCPRLRCAQAPGRASTPSPTLPVRRFKLRRLSVFGPAMTEYVIAWLLAIERNVISRSSHTAGRLPRAAHHG